MHITDWPVSRPTGQGKVSLEASRGHQPDSRWFERPNHDSWVSVAICAVYHWINAAHIGVRVQCRCQMLCVVRLTESSSRELDRLSNILYISLINDGVRCHNPELPFLSAALRPVNKIASHLPSFEPYLFQSHPSFSPIPDRRAVALPFTAGDRRSPLPFPSFRRPIPRWIAFPAALAYTFLLCVKSFPHHLRSSHVQRRLHEHVQSSMLRQQINEEPLMEAFGP